MKGANLTEYVVDSEKCLDSIDDTAATFADLIYQIRDHRTENSTVRVYPEIILTTTDVLATLSPLSRLCFQSSIEAKDDIMGYINQFESFEDYIAQLGTSALAHYFSLKDTLAAITDAIKVSHNSTGAAYYSGKFVMDLFFFAPAIKPTPQFYNFEELRVDQEPMYLDDGTKEALAHQIENSYEAMYIFLTSLNLADGITLDSCKYYASRIAEKIYDGRAII